LALETTGRPAAAKARSIAPATDESSPLKTKSHAAKASGTHACTVTSATRSGIGVPESQCVASRYGCPAERSDAPSAATSNQG
jgi:hypothetical protein